MRFTASFRRSEPPRECGHEWRDYLPPLPWTVECRPPEARSESHPIPASALLHGWLCTSHVPWLAAVPCTHSPRAHAADVRRKEHDVCCRSTARPLLDCGILVSGPDVRQRGGLADVERPEQELVILCGMDS